MREVIIDLYVATFGRAPDPEGLQYWLDRYEDLDLSGIASNMMLSDEAQDRFPGGLEDSELVSLLYNNLFERSPDTEGLEYWVEQMESGAMTREKAVAYIVEGARAETGDPDDAAVIDAKIEAATSYLEQVERGEREFDIQEAEEVVKGAGRDENLTLPIGEGSSVIEDYPEGALTFEFNIQGALESAELTQPEIAGFDTELHSIMLYIPDEVDVDEIGTNNLQDLIDSVDGWEADYGVYTDEQIVQFGPNAAEDGEQVTLTLQGVQDSEAVEVFLS